MNNRGIGYVNHGRWLVDCPTCGGPVMFDPNQSFIAICGVCNPGIMAVAFKEREKGVFVPFADQVARKQAVEQANTFTVTMPAEWKQIFNVLRQREITKMNWLPGETVDQLKLENAYHNVREG